MSERRVTQGSPSETPRPRVIGGPVEMPEHLRDIPLPKLSRKPRGAVQSAQSQEQVQLEAARQALRAQGLPTLAGKVSGDPVYVSPLLEEAGAFSAMQALQELNPEEYIIETGGHYRADARRGGNNGDRFGHVITGKKYETYTIDNPDGTQSVYSQRVPASPFTKISPEEMGVWEETYSAPTGRFKRESSRKLLEKKRVGAESEMVKVMEPDGQEREVFIVYTDKFKEHQKEIREKREQEIQEAVSKVTYVPTEADKKTQKQQVRNLNTMFSYIKESTSEKVAHISKLFAVNGVSSYLFWGPNFLPGGHLLQVPLGIMIGYVGNNMINKVPAENQKFIIQYGGSIAATSIGFAIGGPFALPLGIGLGAAVSFGSKVYFDRKEMKAFMIAHPEIADKKEVKDFLKAEKAKNNRIRFGRQEISEFLADHRETAAQLRRELPELTDRETVRILMQMQKDYTTSTPGYRYNIDAGKKNSKSMLPVFPIYATRLLDLGNLAKNTIGHTIAEFNLPLALITTLYGAIIAPLWRNKMMLALREQIKQEHPELLNGNGKKQ